MDEEQLLIVSNMLYSEWPLLNFKDSFLCVSPIVCQGVLRTACLGINTNRIKYGDSLALDGLERTSIAISW